MAVTIVDIANKLGVSHGTVSRALRDDKQIGEATRKRVRETARDLGYQPNRLARQLVNNKTDMLSILVPDLASPFYSECVKKVDLLVKEKSYHLLPMNTHYDVEREKELINWLPGQYVDGAICLEYDWHNRSNYEHLDLSKPLVVRTWDEMSKHCPFSRVEIDYHAARKKLIAHLVGQGWSKLGILRPVSGGGQLDLSWDNDQISFYRQAVEDTGIELNLENCRLVPLGGGIQQYYEQTKDLLAKQPDLDALIVHNSPWLPAVYGAIEDSNKCVGRDIAVASYDNPPIAEYLRPGVTVLCEPVDKVTQELVRMLMRKLEDKRSPVEAVKIEMDLIIRDSTLKVS